MNTRQHPISTHRQRIVDALLPGGFWRADRFQVEPRPAGLVAVYATKSQVMLSRALNCGFRKA